MDSKGLRNLMEAYQQINAPQEVEQVDEKFSMAVDSSKPQSPRPTKMPKSRERNIGKHNDWKDNPNRDFGERPEKGKKLKSRASAVVQSQRRTDKEVGVREEHELDVFDTILEFLIAEEIAKDIQEANWIMANSITEEQIDEILRMFKKKPEKKTEYAGRSMEPVKKDPGYTVDKRRPEVSVATYGKGGKTDKFKTRGRV